MKKVVLSLMLLIASNIVAATPISERIYHGEEVTDKTLYPWLARIGYNRSPSITVTFCGGVLIHKEWILTAAHCVEDRQQDDTVKVYLNTLDAFGRDGSEQISVSKMHIHPLYRNVGQGNDIALLKLSSPSKQQPVNISSPSDQEYLEGKDSFKDVLTALGWGDTEDPETDYSSTLQSVNLNYITSHDCNEKWWGVDEKQVCAEGIEESQDTCHGDSGGPLYFTNEAGEKVVFGLTSYGAQRCVDLPGVYVKTHAYVDFIEQVTFLGDTEYTLGNNTMNALPSEASSLTFSVKNNSASNQIIKAFIEGELGDTTLKMGENHCQLVGKHLYECLSQGAIKPGEIEQFSVTFSGTAEEYIQHPLTFYVEAAEGEYRHQPVEEILYTVTNKTAIEVTDSMLSRQETNGGYSFEFNVDLRNSSFIVPDELSVEAELPDGVNITSFSHGSCHQEESLLVCKFTNPDIGTDGLTVTFTGTVSEDANPRSQLGFFFTSPEQNSAASDNQVSLSTNSIMKLKLESQASGSSGSDSGGGFGGIAFLGIMLLLCTRRVRAS